VNDGRGVVVVVVVVVVVGRGFLKSEFLLKKVIVVVKLLVSRSSVVVVSKWEKLCLCFCHEGEEEKEGPDTQLHNGLVEVTGGVANTELAGVRPPVEIQVLEEVSPGDSSQLAEVD